MKKFHFRKNGRTTNKRLWINKKQPELKLSLCKFVTAYFDGNKRNGWISRQRGNKKRKQAKFSKKRIFLTPLNAHVRVRMSVSEVLFFEIFVLFCFLVISYCFFITKICRRSSFTNSCDALVVIGCISLRPKLLFPLTVVQNWKCFITLCF